MHNNAKDSASYPWLSLEVVSLLASHILRQEWIKQERYCGEEKNLLTEKLIPLLVGSVRQFGNTGIGAADYSAGWKGNSSGIGDSNSSGCQRKGSWACTVSRGGAEVPAEAIERFRASKCANLFRLCCSEREARWQDPKSATGEYNPRKYTWLELSQDISSSFWKAFF